MKSKKPSKLTPTPKVLSSKKIKKGPRVLLYDIETAPILARIWSLHEEHHSLDQIEQDWFVLAWAAKWLDDPAEKVMYRDQRAVKPLHDDKALLKALVQLFEKADVIVTQNGVRFDQKKIAARMVINDLKPFAPKPQIDTYAIAKRVFGFTSNKLEYLCKALKVPFKKQKHPEFPGNELWAECLHGNKKAWDIMEVYNKHDVLALEGVYKKLRAWDTSVNFTLWNEETGKTAPRHVCSCGSTDVIRQGVRKTLAGSYQTFQCKRCGRWTRAAKNDLSFASRSILHRHIPR